MKVAVRVIGRLERHCPAPGAQAERRQGRNPVTRSSSLKRHPLMRRENDFDDPDPITGKKVTPAKKTYSKRASPY